MVYRRKLRKERNSAVGFTHCAVEYMTLKNESHLSRDEISNTLRTYVNIE